MITKITKTVSPKENFFLEYMIYPLDRQNTNDLSFASTETKFIKPKTKTQNNIVIFGFFHKKIKLLFWLFLKKFD